VAGIGQQGKRMPNDAENYFEQNVGGIERDADGEGRIKISAGMGVVVGHGISAQV
jgi:hypothetical protein